MATRITVKYTGVEHYSGLAGLAVGTEFKAVEFCDTKGKPIGAVIRGSSLAKATKNKKAFFLKKYIFIFGCDHSSMEAV